jgi:hypothetical protein
VTDGTTTLTNAPRALHRSQRKGVSAERQDNVCGTDAELKNIGLKLLVPGARAKTRCPMSNPAFHQTAETQPGMPPKVMPPRRAIGCVDRSPCGRGRNLVAPTAQCRQGWTDYVHGTGLARYQPRRLEMLRGSGAWPKAVMQHCMEADVESVQPVIPHTPAGLLQRRHRRHPVIYRPSSPQVGQKAVRFVERRARTCNRRGRSTCCERSRPNGPGFR